MLQLINTKVNRPRTEACMDLEMLGTPSSARIIEDVDLALKVLEFFYRKNGAAVEGLADINGNRGK